jgi:hypothetical protein
MFPYCLSHGENRGSSPLGSAELEANILFLDELRESESAGFATRLPDRLGVIDLAIKAWIGAETGEPSP